MIDPTSIPQYKPEEIEPKWQARWEADGIYHADPDPKHTKFYALTMLRIPLVTAYRSLVRDDPSDARARFKRMQGYNVFFPSASMPLVYPPKTPRSKNRSILSSGPMPISSACVRSYAPWATCSIGAARWLPLTPNTTAGRSGFSSSFSSTI